MSFNSLNIVLYQPQIPPNTGNVARLCVATQCRLHLIHPLGFETDDARMRRAGLDYWQHLDLQHHASWSDFYAASQDARHYFFSKKSQRPYSEIEFHEGDYLIFGAETTGLPDVLFEQFAEQFYTIPMWGPTRSLNLSSSVAIVAYEGLRQIRHGFR